VGKSYAVRQVSLDLTGEDDAGDLRERIPGTVTLPSPTGGATLMFPPVPLLEIRMQPITFLDGSRTGRQ
jgi:hypothetical protein